MARTVEHRSASSPRPRRAAGAETRTDFDGMDQRGRIKNPDAFIVDYYLHEIGQIELLTEPEMRELEAKLQAGSSEARQELARRNTRLVPRYGTEFVGRRVPYGDLLQEGNVGLLKAAEKFDPAKKKKFSTYARWWIRARMTRHVKNMSFPFHVPEHMVLLVGKAYRVESELYQELQRTPTIDEVVERLGVESPEVRQNLLWLLGKGVREAADEFVETVEKNQQPLDELVADPEHNRAHSLELSLVMAQQEEQQQLHQVSQVIAKILDDYRRKKMIDISDGTSRTKLTTIEDDIKVFLYKFGLEDGQLHNDPEVAEHFNGKSISWVKLAVKRVKDFITKHPLSRELQETMYSLAAGG